MGQTNISIRVDEDVKKEAEILCAKIGLTLSAVTNVFYRQFIRAQGIPFPITALEPNQINENDGGFLLREALSEAQEQSKINRTSEMTLDEINDIIAEVRHKLK